MITCTFEEGNAADPGLRHVVVDVVVVRADMVLLVKRAAALPDGGKWAIAGGYLDRDELLTQAASREVLEETGWQLRDLTLLRINDHPGRSGDDRQNVSFVYMATAAQKVGEADWESDEQRWFAWSDLPPRTEIAFDHADVLDLYQRHREKPFPLPVLG